MQGKNKKQNIYHRILKPAFSVLAIFSLFFPNLSPLLAESQKEKAFAYGVLAVNTDKAFYEPGEEVLVQMASLDSTGHTLCNSNLQLEIITPDGSYKSYATPVAEPINRHATGQANTTDKTYKTNASNESDNLITNNSTCGDNNVTDEPDYTARYIVPSAEGIYRTILKNLDTNLETTNIFQVKNNLPFSVERKTATRINPFKSAYRVEIFITANKDFIGQAEELVQEGFEISNFGSAKKSNYQDPDLGNFQKLIWPIALKTGERISLSYVYSAPKISPEFFRIGYLQLRSATVPEILSGIEENFSGVVHFAEGRPWQIASDITVSGIVYDTDEATNLGSGYALKLAVGAGTVYNATTTAGGAFSFNVTTATAGDILTIWLSTTTKGTLVLKYGSSCTGYSDCTSLAVVKNQVRLENKHTGSMTITDLTACDNDTGAVCGSTDIGFVAVSGANASTTLSWSTNILKVNTGVTFAPGGHVTAQKLSVAGTYTGGTETITLSGAGTSATCTSANQTALCVSGTFTSNSNTVKYTGTSAASIPVLAYNNLELAPSSAGSPTITLPGSSGGGSPDWYSTGGTWGYRKAITINYNKIASSTGETYANFPVLLHVAGDANLKHTGSGGNVASSTGGDILITSSDGTTKLNYEIEKYSSSTGETIAWVKVPSLSTTTNTTLYMYYGNASAPYNATTTGVWDSNYRFVNHFGNGTTLSLTDSTSNNYNANSYNSPVASAGKINGAYLSASSGGKWVEWNHTYGDFSGNFTVSFWMNMVNSSTGNGDFVFGQMYGATDFNHLYIDASTQKLSSAIRKDNGAGSYKNISDTAFSTGTWYHVVVTMDSSNNVIGYVNGASKSDTHTANMRMNEGLGSVLRSGAAASWWNHNDAHYDEVRFAHTVRSADWIKTEYANQSATSTFYTVGEEQSPTMGISSMVINSNLTIGDGTNPVTLNANTNNASTTILGNFTINANATYIAASSSPLNLAGSFTNNGTFTHSNSTTTFTSTSGTKNIVGNNTFYNLEFNGNGGTFNLLSGAGASGDWYSTGGTWDYRKAITIDKTKVSTASGTALSNFPVLLHVAGDANLKHTGSGGNVASSTGGDILITSSDGTTKLNYEIELYSSSTGETIAWVKVPTLSTTTNTTLYMYYGNASAPYNATTTGVWDSDYKGVWHLADNAANTTVASSKSSGSTGANIANTSTKTLTGKIGNALTYNGSNDKTTISGVDSPINITNSSFSVEAWAKRNSAGTYDMIFGQGDTGSANIALHIGFRDSNTFTCGFYGNDADTSATYTDTDWHHWVCTFDSVTKARKIYRDGVQVALSAGGTASANYSGSGNSYIGNWGTWSSTGWFVGAIDEARVSASVRSPDWIATGYGNQNATTTFYSVGIQENYSNGIVVANNLAVSAGTVTSTSTITVSGGSVSGNGTINITGGTFTLSGVGNFGGNTAWTFNNLTFGATASTTAIGTTTVTGILTNSGSLSAGSKTWTLSGSSTPFVNSGTFYPGTSTFNYTGASNATITSASYYNLSLAPAGTPTYTIAEGSTSGWYSTGGTWDYRKAITIDKTKIASSTGETYANFPVLLHVAGDANLKHTGSGGNVASSTGGDILITSSDGTTKLNYEIEKYSSSTGETIAWVKVPSLSTTTNTTLYMYYGNASAPYNATTTGVWDSNYKGVWHLANGTTLSGADSVGIGNGTLVGTPTAGTGKIDGSMTIGATTAYINAGSSNEYNFTSSAFTVEAWIKPPASGQADWQTFISRGTYTSNGWYIQTDNSADRNGVYFVTNQSGAYQYSVAANKLTLSAWNHVVAVRNGTSVRIYVNGTDQTTTANSHTNPVSVSTDLTIGRWLNGMDEVRISNTNRSADWIKTGYTNQNATTTFYSVGEQEVYTGPGFIISNNFTVGNGSHSVVVVAPASGVTINGTTTVSSGTLNLNTNNAPATFVGNITIAGTLSAPASATFILQGNFTNNGTFTHNNGTVTITPVATSTIGGSTVTTFYNLTSNAPFKELRFKNSQQLGVAGLLTLSGWETAPLDITSDSSGIQWLLNLTGTASYNYIRIKDSGCSAGSVNQTEKVTDRGNNSGSCWGLIIRGGGSVTTRDESAGGGDQTTGGGEDGGDTDGGGGGGDQQDGGEDQGAGGGAAP